MQRHAFRDVSGGRPTFRTRLRRKWPIRVPGGTARACSFPEEETTLQATLAGHKAPATSVTRPMLPHFRPLTAENPNSQRRIPGWREGVPAHAHRRDQWARRRVGLGGQRGERQLDEKSHAHHATSVRTRRAPAPGIFRRVCCRPVQIVSGRWTWRIGVFVWGRTVNLSSSLASTGRRALGLSLIE